MKAQQSGAGLLLPVILVITVAAFAVIVAASQSGSDVQGSDAHADSVEALYLAETGVERALKRFASGVAACSGLAEAITDLTQIGIASGRTIDILGGLTTQFDGVTLLPAQTQCRVVATGRVNASNASRTIHAIVDRNILEGPDNPTFNNPLLAGGPSGWTLNLASRFAVDGGPDGTAPSCRRSAWVARETAAKAAAKDRTASGKVTVTAAITAGSKTSIRYHRRSITRGAGCPATAAGPAIPCPAAATKGTICFQLAGAGGPWTSANDNFNPVAPGPNLGGCPTAFKACPTDYTGFPAKIVLPDLVMAGGTTITSVTFFMRAQSAGVAGQHEMFLDNIEVTNPSAIGAAQVRVWRDCSSAADPANCV